MELPVTKGQSRSIMNRSRTADKVANKTHA